MKALLGMHDLYAQPRTELPRPFINSITSLRFLAAFAIFLLHSSNHGLFPIGVLGGLDLSKAVSFFFCLSGFVLSYNYHGRTIKKSTFFKNRFARLFPSTFVST